MTDGDLLRAAVLSQPDEDTPRLAYADWLDEVGGEREVAYAGFIRRQIADPDEVIRLAGGDSYCANGGSTQLFRVPAYRDKTPEGHRETWFIRRGFVDHVEVSLKGLMQNAPELFREPVTGVELRDRQPQTANGGRFRWWVSSMSFREYPTSSTWTVRAWLPSELAEVCRKPVEAIHHGRNVIEVLFDTHELAEQTLEKTALRWGRQQLTLPAGMVA